LVEKKIKCIITTAVGLFFDNELSDFVHISYPMNDIESYNISKHFDDTYEKIENNLKQGSVLVHCAAGVSRSATTVIAYLMKHNEWSFQKAFNLVRRKRKIICPNDGFLA